MSREKLRAYERCQNEILALCEGEDDIVAKMASVVGVLHNAMVEFYWTGFYRVAGDELVIGPYQGTVGCLRIKFGKGVCGAAAELRETQVVKDVHEFPGHIACDVNSQSEIVVPVLSEAGELMAVLDIDSAKKETFDDFDRAALEKILRKVFASS